MQINIDIDLRGFEAETLRDMKRIAYSTTQAINETLKDIQIAERAELDRRFVIRKNRFMYSLIKISRFAKVFTGTGPQTLFGEIEIDASKTRVLLQEFVEGGYKDPAFGKHVAVPITGSAARPSFSDPVTASLMISRLDFHQHVTATGKIQWRGAQRTFIIPGVGVFQRGGEIKTRRRADRFLGNGGRSVDEQTATKMLYKFVTHPALRKRYDFVEIAERVVDERFERNFDVAFGRVQ
jgi:hypothetical protein